ncbi:MAG: hypothetical protein Q8W45_05050 [Candidatus Palauibacterales bacterium]|nr:hypothetical protein [Candidatus Palauibacterales bacterium]
MTWIRRTLVFTAGTLLAVTPGVTPLHSGAALAQELTIEEWTVPWEGSRPRDPYVAPDGSVWFVGQTADYAARLNPGDGTFERFDLPAGAGPHNLIVDGDGIIWYAGNRAAYIGRLDPATGDITRYEMPDSRASDPHTLVFDSEGRIWFTVQMGTMIGRFVPSTGAVDLVSVPTPNSRPYGIKIDDEDRPWVAEFAGGKIATVDPATLELREYDLPRSAARPRRLVITSDGGIWYVDFAGGFLGRLDRVTGEVQEYPMPGGEGSRPYGMAVDGRDRIWFVETGLRPNRFVGFDTKGRQFIARADIPSGGATVRHMYYDPIRQVVWFGTDANTIGRALLP